MSYFRKVGDGIEAYSAASELLKLAVCRSQIGRRRSRVFCYYSWRAAMAGEDAPLDKEELDALVNHALPLLHLVGKQEHQEVVRTLLGHPSITVPLTTMQDPRIYQNTGGQAEFDIFFSCMFTREHMARKNADLLMSLLDRYPKLRVAWVGGYDPYERWLMETEFNGHLRSFGPAGERADPLWSEYESSMCWYLGGGVFSTELEKQSTLLRLVEESARRGHRVQFYANLSRQEVVHLLNRCRASLTLSTADHWPRSITEALACGTPVVAVKSLIVGLDAISVTTGAMVAPELDAIMTALEKVWSLRRCDVREAYFQHFGLERGVAKIIQLADEMQPDWADIVTVERPAETRFKRAVRHQIEQMCSGGQR